MQNFRNIRYAIMQFLVLCQSGMRSATARFVYINDQYESLSVPITMHCMVLDFIKELKWFIGSYEEHLLFEVLHFVTVCLGYCSGVM